MDPSAQASALVAREGRGDAPFGLYVLASGDPMSELGRHVERAVFGEFFGEDEDLLRAEYAPYEPSSVFLVVIEHRSSEPVGALRVILPSAAGFKCLDDLERVWGEPASTVLERSGITYDASTFWEIATIAVMPGYRSAATNGLISLAMVQGVITLGNTNGVNLGLAVFDLVALDVVQAVCGRAWTPFPGLDPRPYLGSPSSIACFCDMPEFGARLAFTDAELYGTLWEGRGLEGVVSTPTWDLDVAAVLRRAG